MSIVEYKEYFIHYLQSVPEQIQSAPSVLPSLISYNARATCSYSMNILDRINWLNEQYCNKITQVNTSGDVKVLNTVSVKNATLPSKVRFKKKKLN